MDEQDLVRRAAWPRDRSLTNAVHRVLHHAQEVSGGAIDHAHRASDAIIAHAELRGRRMVQTIGDETRSVVADVDERLHRQREALVRDGERLFDAVFDRILATALAVAVFAAINYYRQLTLYDVQDPISVFGLFWVGTSFMTLILFVVSRVIGQGRRLQRLIAWECYIIALAGVLVATLLLVRQISKWVAL